MQRIGRRQFAQDASLAFLAGVSVIVSSCAGGSGGGGGSSSSSDGYGPTGSSGTPTQSTPPATPAAGSVSGQISDNHGHQAVITAAELQAGGALRLDIAGSAGHSHIVDLAAPEVQLIRDGQRVQKESTTTEGHDHMVAFNAGASDPGTGY